MRIMTFNLRFENSNDGANEWLHRREMIVDLIGRHSPGILGTQEGKWSQLTFLREHLPEYELYAPQREVNDICQYPTLFLRKGEIDGLEGSEFWLSKTPEVLGSKDWDSAFPRMMSYARVTPSGENRPFWVAVTHLDHIGAEARLGQSGILAQWVRKRKGPVILMGDFNDHPGSPVHRLLTSPLTGLQDSWQILEREEGRSSYTHHGFKGTPQKTRMDWILVSSHFRVLNAMIIRDNREGRYPSDHFPYALDLDWEDRGTNAG
jgi:endonuclease/exonuclease/phosphatase family metal-dependent hydrolase